MATLDYKGAKVVTITNNAVEKPIDDAGTQPNADGFKVIPADRFVQYYGKNLWTKLASGDSVEITTSTAAEVAFYVAQGTDEITVAVADVETESGGGGDDA